MSHQEIDRLAVIQRVGSRQLSQKEAARQLNLGIRQVKRLVKRFRDKGAAGLISKHRGKIANNRLPTKVKERVRVCGVRPAQPFELKEKTFSI